MNKTIIICWIGIGNYNVLFDDFYKSFNKNFCNDLDKTFFVFTDQPEKYQNLNNVKVYLIPNACQHKGFILFRKWKYCLLAEDQYLNYDYVCFANGNMVCKEIVNSDELINSVKPISIITHPCNLWTYKNTRNCDSRSLASFCPTEDWQYKQAGFNVSTSKEFLKMANTIESWRHLDKATGNDKYVTVHDETYANRYFYENKDKINVLDGQIYCFPTDVPYLQPKFKDCKLYTRGKQQEFAKYNMQFVNTTAADLYNLS